MTAKLGRLLLSLVLAAFAVSWAVALDDNDTKSKGDVRTVTGCLSKGDSADEFVLTGNDGSTWEVRNSKSGVNFSNHVGHTVTATGVVSHAKMHNMKEDSKEMAKDSGVKKDSTEHGHLKVTDLQMVSDSCQR